VVETDIASCFSAIPHEKLMQAVEERVCDQPVLKLLRAGVMEDGDVGPGLKLALDADPRAPAPVCPPGHRQHERADGQG
jgi:RNA-directed DNA polymerase